MPGNSGGGTEVLGGKDGGETTSEIGGLDLGAKQRDIAGETSDNSGDGFQVVHKTILKCK